MPPKKKGKGKGKGKGKKKGKKDDATLELEDKYKRTMDEIEALKDHLAIRKEYTRRAQSASHQVQERMSKAETMLQEHVSDQKSINADMTRQYKTMQTEMGLKIHHLEAELIRTRTHLDMTKEELKSTQEERDRMVKERDEEIHSLNIKVSSMEKAYEVILREALDNLTMKITDARKQWENKTTHIHGKAKQVLLELGLNPLDI
ncbi:dynein regulatory complex protein 12-like [Littorina saxatilis]|uniref:Dynein regulatory complex protein 12 n=1 Tax=Littorina saxatilis TaxID=31220 RepID=A0AAN9GEG1_9CAEN